MADLEQLWSDIAAQQLNTGDAPRAVYASMVCDALADNGTLANPEMAFFERRFGVSTFLTDGYSIDPERQILTFVIADLIDADGDQLVNDKFVADIQKQVRAFLSDAMRRELERDIDQSEPIKPALEALRDAQEIHIRVLSTRRASRALGTIEAFEVGQVKCSLYVYPLDAVLNLLYEPTLDPIEIDFVQMFNGHVLSMKSAEGPDISCWLAVIPGEWLARIYEKYQARLLERNVRSFLQFKGGINKGIRNTVLNTPGLFFAYNNGISATVAAIEFAEGSRAKIAKMRGLQIVNGGQTTASLYQILRTNGASALASVSVMAKITLIRAHSTEETSNSDVELEVVQNISKFSNSQNKVTESDFFSNHPFHVAVEKVALREWSPLRTGEIKPTKWFYERTRGGYANYLSAPKSRAEQNKRKSELPAAQRIDKLALAKAQLMFMQQPHIVAQGAQKAFSAYAGAIGAKWVPEKSVVTSAWWRDAVSETLVIGALTKAVSCAPWYNGGLRAQVVAYSISLAASALQARRMVFNYSSVWRDQEPPDDMILWLTNTAKCAHDELIRTGPLHGKTNITEWAKMQRCIEVLKASIKIEVPDAVGWIQSRAEAIAGARSERTNEREWDDVSAQVEVGSLPPAYWHCVKGWNDTSPQLTEAEVVNTYNAHVRQNSFVSSGQGTTEGPSATNRSRHGDRKRWTRTVPVGRVDLGFVLWELSFTRRVHFDWKLRNITDKLGAVALSPRVNITRYNSLRRNYRIM